MKRKLKILILWWGGSPCQDFSIIGKQEGAKWTCQSCQHEYNPLEVHYTTRDKCPKCESTNIEKTRSSLLVEWLRILREKKPNLAIYENVKNIVGQKHKQTFDLFITELNEYGYNAYFQVLNAKDYGVLQNRERMYLIIIKKELDSGSFTFPKPFINQVKLKDILHNAVEDKYYLSKDEIIRMRNTNFKKDTYKKGTIEICNQLLNETCDIDFLVCDYRYDEGIRIRKDNICPCLTTKSISKSLSGKPLVIINGKLRQLTHDEILKLMGFSTGDYNVNINHGITETQISKQAGNSVVVDVLYYILLEIYKSMPYLLEDIKLGSFFSGIGSFEKAIYRLIETVNNKNT
jgi:DNA (cytosine-5)-methyltransferase 1